MVAEHIDREIIAQRMLWINEMIDALRELPIKDKDEFFSNKHNMAAAESYLRRALEALFDMGRHILAKGFAYPASEYKEIANKLFQKKVITQDKLDLMRKMAGYRNRMVHFYHEITPEELYTICHDHLDEIKILLGELIEWVSKENK
jgi:uncharacterized protein YutE (UPF0331/DUF86 family)